MNSSGEAERFADVRKHLPFLARRESLAGLLENLLGYPRIRLAFADSAHEDNPFDSVARRLGMTIRVVGEWQQIPDSGPVVFVANHGHGGADALALMALMRRVRADIRVLANKEVGLLDGLESYLFPVSILEGPDASENVRSLRAMLKHVRAGGCLGVFPAGRVAFWQGDRMCDPPWNDHVIKLLQRMKATIVPVWFYGSPSPVSNLLSRLSPFVRTALIPTGLARMNEREITVRVGLPFSSRVLGEAKEMAGPWLRRNLESLADLGN